MADTEAKAGPADESLLDLIDRLAALLDRTELTELEVQVGATGLVLRKPSALDRATPWSASSAVQGWGVAPSSPRAP